MKLQAMSGGRGFTLVETLIAIGIASIAISGTLSLLPRLIEPRSLSQEAEKIVALLQKARSDSMTSKNGSSYGFQATADAYILFAGAKALDDPNPLVFKHSREIEASNEVVVFERGSGSVDHDIEITITNNEDEAVVTINEAGAISF